MLKFLIVNLIVLMTVSAPVMAQTTVVRQTSEDRTVSILSLLIGEETDSSSNTLSKEGKIIDWGWLGTVEPVVDFTTGALTFITDAVSDEESYYTSGSKLPTTTLHIWKPASASDSWSVSRRMAAGRHGSITSGFGWREKFGRNHYGIDIAMHVGDTVRTPMSGVVDRICFEARGYGHYMVILHDDGMETRYAHLNGTLVPAGTRVRAGDAIALSGNTGRSTGPHLHFETRCFGLPIDPETIFNFAGTTITPRFK